VNLLFAIERGTPIREDTVAVLKTQGLTGIAYVELSGGTRDAPPLLAIDGSDYPLIRTKPSLSARLENVLTTVLSKLDSLSNNVNSPSSATRTGRPSPARSPISPLVAHTIAARKDALDSGITHAARTFENTSRATAQIGPVVDRIGRSADAVAKWGKRSPAPAPAPQDGRRGRRRPAALRHETLPELERLLEELTVLSTSLRRLAEQTERNPARLLFGRRPVPEGPANPHQQEHDSHDPLVHRTPRPAVPRRPV
jgi:phospholipid/cholesterol/gamma-HCH transport system substrate-binding protein